MVTALMRNKRLMPVTVLATAFVVAMLIMLLLGSTVTELAIGIGGGIGISVLMFATYKAGRRYGQPHSHAVATAAIAFGVMYLIALVFRLLTTFSPS